jgi:hypothetical protein
MGFEGASRMSDQHFLKCNCQHCGSPIEFPSEGVGLTIECPNCGQQTLLSEAAAMADDPLLPASSADVETASSPESHPQCGQRNKSRVLAGALVLLTLAAAAGIAWYFIAGPGAKNPEPSVSKKPDPQMAKKSEPVVASAFPANPASNAPAAEPAEPGNSVESSQNPPKSIDDLKPGFVTLEKAKAGNLTYAVGTIKNHSDQQRFGVKVELELTDARGNPAGKASDYTQVIEPHQEWRFRALVVDTGRTKAVTARVSSIKEDN